MDPHNQTFSRQENWIQLKTAVGIWARSSEPRIPQVQRGVIASAPPGSVKTACDTAFQIADSTPPSHADRVHSVWPPAVWTQMGDFLSESFPDVKPAPLSFTVFTSPEVFCVLISFVPSVLQYFVSTGLLFWDIFLKKWRLARRTRLLTDRRMWLQIRETFFIYYWIKKLTKSTTTTKSQQFLSYSQSGRLVSTRG